MTARTRLVSTLVLGLAVLVPRIHADIERRIYVSILDDKGTPRAGVSARDVSVRVDGNAADVSDVRPATEPLSVVILTDRFGHPQFHLDSTYNVIDLREALARGAAALHTAQPATRISLVSIDGASTVQAGFTSDLSALTSVIKKQSPTTELSVLMDGVLDATHALSAGPGDRRAIVALIAGLNVDRDVLREDVAGRAVLDSGASFWALEGFSPLADPGTTATHEAFMREASRLSGGRFLTTASGGGLVSQTTRLAAQLAGQYAVTYRPKNASGRTLAVSVAIPGVTVSAPAQAPR